MAYFQDFTVCDHGWDGWLCRLMAIGWLERGHEYPRGPCPDGLVEKLERLRAAFRVAFPASHPRGLHHCSLCEGPGRLLAESHVNLFIPFQGLVFVAPGRVDHHLSVHGYLPPQDFVTAVLECPLPTEPGYRQLVRRANRHQDAPLYDEEERWRRWR